MGVILAAVSAKTGTVFVVVGCLMLAMAVFGLLAPDAAWRLHRRHARAYGIEAPVRTPEWESRNALGSVVMLIAGIMMVIIGIALPLSAKDEPRGVIPVHPGTPEWQELQRQIQSEGR